MSKIKQVGVAGVLAVSMLIPMLASASVITLQKQVVVPASSTIAEDLYLIGGSVTSSGRVLGDLTATGGTIVVNGPIAVDAAIAGGNVTVLGSIGDDLRIAGGNVTVNASVGGDLMFAGGNVTIAGDRIGGDVAGVGGTITLTTPVRGNLHVKGGQVYLNAPINGSVIVTAGEVTLGSAAVISGSFTYSARNEATMEQGAHVSGATNFIQHKVEASVKGRAAALLSVLLLIKFVSMLIGGLFLGLFFRRYSITMLESVQTGTLGNLARGVITMIVLPVLSVILLVTVVGIPFGVLGIVTFIALCTLGALMTPVLIGAYLWKWIFKAPLAVSWDRILVGVILYSLLGFIPIIGWLLMLLLTLLAIGATVRIKLGILAQWR